MLALVWIALAAVMGRDYSRKAQQSMMHVAPAAVEPIPDLLYAPGESEEGLPSLTSLYALCNAIAQTLAELQLEAAAKRSAEIARALSELS